MADAPEFDPTKPFEDATPSAPAPDAPAASAAPEFDPSKPFEDATNTPPAPKAARTWKDVVTDPFTDIGPEIAKEASDAWQGAKEGLTAPPEPGVSGAVKNVWDTTKGLANAARIPFSPITGAARSLVGHPMADLEQAAGEYVVNPLLKSAGVPEDKLQHPAYEGMYTKAKQDVDTSLSAIPANRQVPHITVRPPPPQAPFGVTLSEAERTGDLPARQFEQAGLRGQVGSPAQEHAQEFFNVQRPQEVQESRNVVSRNLDPTGNQVLAETPAQAAEMAQQSLQRESARSKAQVKSLYDQAKALPGEISANTFTDMPQNIKTNLSNRPDSVIIDDNTPVASRMITYLNNQIGQLKIKNLAQPESRGLAAPGPAPIVGVNLEGVEQWRKNLSRMRGEALANYTNPSDSRAANAVINEFDSMIGQAVNSGAFRGDPRAVDLFNDARAAHAARMRQWGNDAVGRRLQSIIGDAATGRDPASLNDVANWMYSASGTAPNSLNIGVVRRIRNVLGADSPEWAAIRQGMFRRLINEVEEGVQAGPGTVATRLNKFLNGSGSDMANAMFSAPERQMLQEYADLHRQMSIPLQGANWSNTAAGAAPHIKKVGDKIVGAIGALIGHHISPVLGGLAGYAAGERLAGVMNNRENARHAAQIARQLPIVTRQVQQWQQAARAQARQATITNTRRLAFTTSNLVNALSRVGIDSSTAMRILTQSGPEGPGTGEAKERASGGSVDGVNGGGADGIDVDGFSDNLTAGPDRSISHFADGGVPTFDERFAGTTPDDPSPDDMVDNVAARSAANDPPPAPDDSWKEAEAQSNLAAQQAANPPQDKESYWDKATDAAKRFAGYTGQFVSDVANFPQWAYEHPDKLKENAERLVGMGGGERYQTWPEKVARSGATLAGDTLSGQVPQWSEDPATGEVHTSPQMIERAQDMAALASSGGVGGVEASGADATLGSGPFLRPALKYEGKIYKAPVGGQHLEALPPPLRDTYMRQAMNGDDISNFDFGFMNHKGQFMNREAALDYAINNGLADPASSKYRVLTTDFLDNNIHPELQKAYNTLRSDTTEPGAAVIDANNHSEDVSRPVQHQKDEREINVPERAAGGRVVLSNINHSPSEAQKHAGNYAKEHIRAHGLDFTIENAKGKERSGVGKDGRRWSVKLPEHYGYIKRTKGADGDHVDVYMGPHMKSKHVFVINQVDADTKKFDEHKVCIGMRCLEHALKTYENGFSDGRGLDRIGSIFPTTIDTFKHWLEHGDTKKPFRLN